MSLFLRCWVCASTKFSRNRVAALVRKSSSVRQMTVRQPPRAMSEKPMWYPKPSRAKKNVTRNGVVDGRSAVNSGPSSARYAGLRRNPKACCSLDEVVRLERVANEHQAALEDGAPQVVEVLVARVEGLHRLLGGRQHLRVVGLAVLEGRVEARAEQLHQLRDQAGVRQEGVLHLFPVEAVGLRVAQVGVTEGDEGVHQRGLLAAHAARQHPALVLGRAHVEDLRVEQLPAQLDVEV